MSRLVSFFRSTSCAVLLFHAALLLFNWPILSLSSEPGGTSLFRYIFIAWFVLICCLTVMGHSLRHGHNDSKG